MRDDMAKVIVERPRHRVKYGCKGRSRPLEDLPTHQAMRRPWMESGRWKELNENLKPLRRYLERQVGRPWNKVYAEITAQLRVNSAVQQHVRDHVWDFVAIRSHKWPPNEWYRWLYVDPTDGILKRLKVRQKLRPKRDERKIERVPLPGDRELRLEKGLWYEARLAQLPDPVYRVVTKKRKVQWFYYPPSAPVTETTVVVRRLMTPPVYDAVSGAAIFAGPEFDDEHLWEEYRRRHPDRHCAVAKRSLSRKELRRYGLQNDVPAD